jgi:hypothetical protein
MESNTFTCHKGHTFTAVAKLRARCPECGELVRRTFTSASPAPEVHEVAESTTPVKGRARIVRTGKPRSAAQRANDARLAALHKKPVPKAAPAKPATRGVLKTKRVAPPVTPTVHKRPTKTAVSKHASAFGAKQRSVLEEMMERAGFR